MINTILQGFIRRVIMTSTDISLVLWLCRAKKPKAFWWVFFLVLNAGQGWLEYTMWDALLVRNTSYTLRFLIMLLAAFLCTESSPPAKLYYTTMVRATTDVTGEILGKGLSLLLGADLLVSNDIPAFFTAHLVLILFRVSFALTIRRYSHRPLACLTDMRDAGIIVIPVLFFIVVRDIIRMAGLLPADLDDQTFILTVSYGLMAIYGSIMTANLFYQKHLLEADAVRSLIHRQESQYEMRRDTVERINRVYHDLRHILRSILSTENVEEIHRTAREYMGEIQNYESIFHTGNETLDLILDEKYHVCQEKNIQLIFQGEAEGWNVIRRTDLAVLFGNALDNAIDGVSTLPASEDRLITLKTGTIHDMLYAGITNKFQGTLNYSSGRYRSTKTPEELHGYGILSMQALLEKYDGSMDIHVDGQEFSVSYLIPRK